ncbi:MAG: shikimate kinase [Ferroplasma sp.]|uniref:shikimate kinase n=1 Tax=Ferroplasma sp. TaxID=2591003 RepID=UPI0028168AFB|nr:shikimate kinase [Ferroplasma sp.]WMT51745.1 MAG: shikimate kinase [Ferroplasma sp.]
MIVEANGGISIISAFVNGHGAAAALKLPMQTEITPTDQDSFPSTEIGKLVDYIRNIYKISGNYSISIRSEIPPGMGLKSSSALAISVVFGLLKMNSINFTDNEILRNAARASIYNNTSVTGAMDDLAMSYYGGYCLTDNGNFRLLSRHELEEDFVLICTGKDTVESINLKKKDFSPYINFYNRLEDNLKAGRVYETMVLNGLIFDDGNDSKAVKTILATGAFLAGRSGKGPAIFGLYKSEEHIDRASKLLLSDGYSIIKSRFNNRGIHISEP